MGQCFCKNFCGPNPQMTLTKPSQVYPAQHMINTIQHDQSRCLGIPYRDHRIVKSEMQFDYSKQDIENCQNMKREKLGW